MLALQYQLVSVSVDHIGWKKKVACAKMCVAPEMWLYGAPECFLAFWGNKELCYLLLLTTSNSGWPWKVAIKWLCICHVCYFVVWSRAAVRWHAGLPHFHRCPVRKRMRSYTARQMVSAARLIDWLIDWVGFNVPLKEVVVLRIGFNPTRSTSPCYSTTHACNIHSYRKIHTYTKMNLSTVKWAQWDKPNPENC